jgi:hypothetical protein
VVVGGIYSPNHQSGRWGRLLSTSAPDSPVRHRTLSGALATSPNRWGSTVGALTSGATGQSGGVPDRSCSLSGAPSGACSDSARAVVHCSLFTVAFADDRWRCSHYSAWQIGQSGASLDSPVNYSGEAPRKSEASKLELIYSGAPDTVRWCTGQSGAPDQGSFRFSLLLSFEPFLITLNWFVVNLWNLWNIYSRTNS